MRQYVGISTMSRKLPPKVAAMQARKRQRLDDGRVPRRVHKPTAKSRVAIKPDQLPWREMQMPERLDDWEGMNGGIEEIDDVEIVRDPDTGKVSFKLIASAAPATEESHAVEDNRTSDDHDGTEFEGFEDEDDRQPPSKARKTAAESSPSQKPRAGATSKKVGPAGQGSEDQLFHLPGDKTGADVDTSAWEPLNLSPDTRAALSALGYSKPTPIQTEAIPQVLAGKDVIGKASTGSGKTLAFGIPILEQYLENRHRTSKTEEKRLPLALILSPTRELAHQLEQHLAALCSHVISGGPSIAKITGGLSLQKQQRLLRTADVVVGTPGRLWEVMNEGENVGKALRQIQFLVVDEADRLLSEGQFKEVEEILSSLDRKDDDDDKMEQVEQATANPDRQTLVFSATFDRGLQKKLASKSRPGNELMSNKDSLAYLLAKLNFRSEQPEFVDVNPINQLATGLTEELVQCEGLEKDLYLYTLLFDRPNHRTLVFANSIDAVRRLTPMMQNLGLNALALHSEMEQKARLRSVERFTQAKEGSAKGSILIATDVAARGLDIPNVQTVIHYHLPRAADTYVHRSGRTARAGQKGSSIIICSAKEAAGVRRLIASVHAQAAVRNHTSKREASFIHTLDPERRTITQLKPRLKLAKRIADTELAKQKRSKADSEMRAWAEELGTEYDSEEFEAQAARGKQGRGAGRKKREREARDVSKAELGAMRAELKQLLGQRVNTGWSPKYLTAGGVDVDQLLREREEGRV